jgi:hypothetical protein
MDIENMNDTEIVDALFDALVNRVHTERLNDPAWEDPTTDLSHVERIVSRREACRGVTRRD